jgi:MFS family permease
MKSEGGTDAPHRPPLAVLGIVAIPVFLAISNQTMIAVALPAIGADFAALRLLPLLVTGYMLALTVTGPVYGALGDGYGRGSMLVVALCIYILGAAVCSLAPTIELLVVGRLIQGLGGGGLMALCQALIGQLVSSRERGRAQGHLASVMTIASTAGPLLGGVLVAALGWRSLFLVTIPLALLAILLIVSRPIPRGEIERGSFDFQGLAWLTAFVFSLTAGLEILKEPGQGAWSGMAVACGGVALAGLVRSQRSSSNPLFPPHLMAIPAIWRSNVMVACHGGAVVSFMTIVPLFQTILLGDGTVEVSVILLVLSISWGLGGVVSGNLITLTGRLALFSSVTLPLAAAGLAVLGFFGADLDRFELFALYVFIGLNFGSVMTVAHTTVLNAAPDHLKGRVSGTVTFFRSIGAVLGTATATLVLFAFAPPSTGSGDLSGSVAGAVAGDWREAFQVSFLMVAVFVAVGWLMAVTSPARRIF